MFYYPTVLQRHTGCFSTIWLVATKAIRVPRREFLKVNVKSTCDDIVNYLLEQVPPPRPGLPRPRFSLYLSSQLQYGIIVVFHRQCAILLEELHSILGQLLKQPTSEKIDMDNHSRQALVFSDALSVLEETEGALDPLFGVMYMQHPVPSPSTLIQMSKEYLREASPEITSPAAEPEHGITASPDTITLRETEPVTIPTAEFEGVDLVDQHPDTIDFLLAETDHFPEDSEIPGEEVTPSEQEREIERKTREGDLEEERTKELLGSTIEIQPTALPSDDAMLLPEEEPGLSTEKPASLADEFTHISVPVLPSPPPAAKKTERPSLDLEEVPPQELKMRKRRKRQLIFHDPETQLEQEVLQKQIGNSLFETRPLLLPSSQSVPAAHLFNNPCTVLLPQEVQMIWRQAATITPLPGSDLQFGERGPESTDSEKERGQETVEATEAAEKEQERLELSPKEVPRDLADSEIFDISGMGMLPLEGSEQREASRDLSPMFTSDREGSIVSRSVSTLQDIPEVLDELLEGIGVGSPGLLPELAEHEEASVLFQSLLPPEVNRRTVSTTFKRLLEALSTRKVHAEQKEPYGDILISPGPKYEEVQLTL